MAPVRRYLRITKYSALECRIYLDNPALVHSWLLHPRNPVLPRVIESVRPLVLPKLREEKERERTRKKSSKKRSIKDVVVEEDFEVSIFLTETPTRHSLLYKHKHFRDKTQTRLTSNSTKLTGASADAAIDVEEDDHDDTGGLGREDRGAPLLRREETEGDDPIDLDAIPMVVETVDDDDVEELPTRRSKRRRRGGEPSVPLERNDGSDGGAQSSDEEVGEQEEDDFPEFDSSSDDAGSSMAPPASKRARDNTMTAPAAIGDAELEEDEEEVEDARHDGKKKLAMDISYEGFAIYGRVLCLVVRRREGPLMAAANRSAAGAPSSGNSRVSASQLGGQASMENWITSTQMPAALDELDAS